MVYVDITAPLYWWKEFDTYKVGTVANSCSTIHKIAAKEFTMDDFSHEHLFISRNVPNQFRTTSKDWLLKTIQILNDWRKLYLKTKDKRYWWQMIQLLPLLTTRSGQSCLTTKCWPAFILCGKTISSTSG